MSTPYEEGDPSSPILYLAQAPSYVEIKLDRPLVGPSGEVFNTCLHQAGLVRAGGYILNIWPYQVYKNPHDKDASPSYYKDKACTVKVWDKNAGFTELGLFDAQACLERIRKSTAKVIVAFGAQAFALLWGSKKPIMKWRGSILWSEVVGKKYIPTVHPAATIHGVYLWRYLIINDLKKAKDQRGSVELQLKPRNLLIAPTFSDCMEWLRDRRRSGLINPHTGNPILGTDLEVINHQVSCFSLCYQVHEAMTIPLTNQDGSPYWTEDQETDIWIAYAEIMSDPTIDKLNQNISGFDAVFLLAQMGIFTRGFLGDCMVGQSIMYPEFNMGLDFITSIRTDMPYYKDEGKMWKGFGGPIEQFWQYNGKDAIAAVEAWFDMLPELEDGYWETYNMTVDLYSPTAYMTIRGFLADWDKLKATRKRVGEELEAKTAELKRVAEVDFNPLSPKQCIQYFYVTKGCHPYTGKTGKITTDDKAMSRILRRYNLREAKLVQEIRALNKLKGTYLEISADKDNRIRCSWNLRGTMYGRLSSSATIFGTGLNMQNLHPEFKEFLVADPDPEEE